MKKITANTSLEKILTLLEEKAQDSYLLVGDILKTLSGRGRPLLLIFLSFPFCLPIQIPGISILFGLIISFLGLRITFGRHIWLPKKLLSIKIPSKTILKIAKKSLHFLQKMKRWVHPRMLWMHCYRFMKIMNGLLLITLGLMLALPLPIPFTNIIVSWPIFLISLGLLEDDGLFILIGYGIACCAFLFFFAIGFSIHDSIALLSAPRT
jgi:hypothetical protein